MAEYQNCPSCGNRNRHHVNICIPSHLQINSINGRGIGEFFWMLNLRKQLRLYLMFELEDLLFILCKILECRYEIWMPYIVGRRPCLSILYCSEGIFSNSAPIPTVNKRGGFALLLYSPSWHVGSEASCAPSALSSILSHSSPWTAACTLHYSTQFAQVSGVMVSADHWLSPDSKHISCSPAPAQSSTAVPVYSDSTTLYSL